MSPIAQEVCQHIVSSIVDDRESVQITSTPTDDNSVQLDVRVAEGELGRVIGKRGRVANAIRAVVRAAGSRDGKDVSVEFVD